MTSFAHIRLAILDAYKTCVDDDGTPVVSLSHMAPIIASSLEVSSLKELGYNSLSSFVDDHVDWLVRSRSYVVHEDWEAYLDDEYLSVDDDTVDDIMSELTNIRRRYKSAVDTENRRKAAEEAQAEKEKQEAEAKRQAEEAKAAAEKKQAEAQKQEEEVRKAEEAKKRAQAEAEAKRREAEKSHASLGSSSRANASPSSQRSNQHAQDVKADLIVLERAIQSVTNADFDLVARGLHGHTNVQLQQLLVMNQRLGMMLVHALGAREGPALEDLECPITRAPFVDPVVAADGHTYERSAIVNWLNTHNSSPVTNAPLQHKTIVPNITIKKIVQSVHSQQ
jgi:chemotaxis protein histidine kinase CheA